MKSKMSEYDIDNIHLKNEINLLQRDKNHLTTHIITLQRQVWCYFHENFIIFPSFLDSWQWRYNKKFENWNSRSWKSFERSWPFEISWKFGSIPTLGWYVTISSDNENSESNNGTCNKSN